MGRKDANGNYTDDYAKKVFFAQCAEIAEYGADQFEMWFDGATGADGYYGGANETRSIDNATRYYDIPNLRDSIHNACPNIILWGTGGEARWIGNEAGWAGETCWSMGDGTSGDMNAWKWFPGESDAKATVGGWFYHEGGKKVDGNGNIVVGNEGCKSANELFKMYLETVGRNATLILNFPPNQAGLLSDDQVANLKTLGEMLRTRLGHDLAKADGVKITATDTRSAGVKRTYDAKNMIDGDSTTYWACNDAHNTAVITVELPSVQTIHYVALQEYIQLGQRIKGFTIETSTDGKTGQRRAATFKLPLWAISVSFRSTAALTTATMPAHRPSMLRSALPTAAPAPPFTRSLSIKSTLNTDIYESETLYSSGRTDSAFGRQRTEHQL